MLMCERVWGKSARSSIIFIFVTVRQACSSATAGSSSHCSTAAIASTPPML